MGRMRLNMKRNWGIYTIVCLLACCAAARLTIAAPATVASPNGKIKIEIRIDAADQLTWSVQRQGQTILTAAPLGLTVDGRNLGQSVKLGSSRNRIINEHYPTWGNHAVAVNHCKETVIPVESAGGMKYELEVRAFNDGAAVRICIAPDGAAHTIEGEATSWALPPDSHSWWARYNGDYERPSNPG
jgi:alpha-glucosidase